MSLLPYVMSELRDLSKSLDRPWDMPWDDVVPRRRWCRLDDDDLDDVLLYEARPWRPSTMMRLLEAPVVDSLVVRPRHLRRPSAVAAVRSSGHKKQLKKCLAEKNVQQDASSDDASSAFSVNVDVQQFRPEELSVQVLKDDGCVVVEGKHEERLQQPDEHGYVLRQFTRRYKLPASVDPDTVVSRLTDDGVLQVSAPRKDALPAPKEDSVRHVPIAHTDRPAVAAAAADSEAGNKDKEADKGTVDLEMEQE